MTVRWRKSSYSQVLNNNCVEVAEMGAGAAVRDSRNPELGRLEVPAAEFRALLGAVKRGDL